MPPSKDQGTLHVSFILYHLKIQAKIINTQYQGSIFIYWPNKAHIFIKLHICLKYKNTMYKEILLDTKYIK